jgi:hypothetical protein
VYQDIELSKKAAFKDYLFLPFSDLTSGKKRHWWEVYRFKNSKGKPLQLILI